MTIIFCVCVISSGTWSDTFSCTRECIFWWAAKLCAKVSISKQTIWCIISFGRCQRTFWYTTFWLKIAICTIGTDIVAWLISTIEFVKIESVVCYSRIKTFSHAIIIWPSSVRSGRWTLLITHSIVIKHQWKNAWGNTWTSRIVLPWSSRTCLSACTSTQVPTVDNITDTVTIQ